MISLGLVIFQAAKIRSQLKSSNHNLRGFLKFYNQGIFSDQINSLTKNWLTIVFINFLILMVFIIYITWNTDYNYFIALFPFIWHYMFFRHFLWEKSDITEAK